jgi:hypothetical protein
MSGTSNVGNSQVYEAGDQRNYKDSEIQEAKKENRFHEGKENSHLANDSSTFAPHTISASSLLRPSMRTP